MKTLSKNQKQDVLNSFKAACIARATQWDREREIEEAMEGEFDLHEYIGHFASNIIKPGDQATFSDVSIEWDELEEILKESSTT